MQKITLLDDEWIALTQLAVVPRRRAFAEGEFGLEVIRFLLAKGLVDLDGELLVATPRGHGGLKANPPPSGTGVRVWFEPGTV